MTKLAQCAVLLIRYEGVEYQIGGYTPDYVFNRAQSRPDVLREHDAKHGVQLQKQVLDKLEHIYVSRTIPKRSDEPQPEKVNFLDITRMFG